MFERPRSGQRALLVSLDFGVPEASGHQEFRELACSAGAEVVAMVGGRRRQPDPRYFVGAGKAEEIRAMVLEQSIDLVVVNHGLSPSQERNLERLLQCRVLDRTGLILDIFAQRARSFEGKLQVELAQLRHLSTRLVRGWSHLERQKGGIGLRGPGESQLETDRRLLAARVDQISRRLARVGRQRRQSRGARDKAGLPSIGLVGYTNAGKSTLFNALTGAGVGAANQLFATLDPTIRRLPLTGTTAVLVDTVGFIRDLPHELVAAFRATLEETLSADLLLHVIDASDRHVDEQNAEVEAVLEQAGAGQTPRLRVYNKIDLLDGRPKVDRDGRGQPKAVWVSAGDGRGLAMLREVLSEWFLGAMVTGWVRLPLPRGRARARLFELGAVIEERADESGWLLKVELPRQTYLNVCRQDAIWADPVLREG